MLRFNAIIRSCVFLLAGTMLLFSADLAHARYGSVAIGTNGTLNGEHSTYCTGGSNDWPTQKLADEKALLSCQQAAPHCTDCSVNTRFGAGQCGYRAAGGGNGHSCFGVGPTPQSAHDNCEKNGCTCSAAVGGCNE